MINLIQKRVCCLAILLAVQSQVSAQFETVVNVPPERVPRPFRRDTQLNLFEGAVLESSYSRPFKVGRHSDTNQELNVYGGTVGEQLQVTAGGAVNIYGGVVDRGFQAKEGGAVTVAGGRVRDWFEAEDGSTVTLSGGMIGNFTSHEEAQVNLIGNHFELNGVSLQTGTVLLERDDVLSGVFQDGTPFIFADQTNEFTIGTGVAGVMPKASLIQTPLSETDLTPKVVESPTDLPGLVPGQTLYLEEGGELLDGFTAIGATLHINAGRTGKIEALRSEVNFGAGSMDGDFHAFNGTNVVFCGGISYEGVFAYHGSTVQIVSGDILASVVAEPKSSVTIAGGSIGGFLSAAPGSDVTLIGTEFAIDGEAIEDPQSFGNQPLAATDKWTTLSGVFADGSPFSFTRATLGTFIHNGATLDLKVVPKFDCNADLVVDIADTACAVSGNISEVLASADLIVGDLNGDGTVAFDDFTIFSDNFGRSGGYQQGNLDRVAGIEFNDFLVFAEHFGQSSTPETTAVPEPSTFLLLTIMAVLVLRVRRWR